MTNSLTAFVVLVSIPQAVGTVATRPKFAPPPLIHGGVSIPQAVGTVATKNDAYRLVWDHEVSIPQAVGTVATGN